MRVSPKGILRQSSAYHRGVCSQRSGHAWTRHNGRGIYAERSMDLYRQLRGGGRVCLFRQSVKLLPKGIVGSNPARLTYSAERGIRRRKTPQTGHAVMVKWLPHWTFNPGSRVQFPLAVRRSPLPVIAGQAVNVPAGCGRGAGTGKYMPGDRWTCTGFPPDLSARSGCCGRAFFLCHFPLYRLSYCGWNRRCGC